MASGATSTYGLPYPLSTDGVDVAGDIADLAVAVEGILLTKSSNADVALKAPIASPTFTGTPLLTTNPSADDNTTKIASTAFVIGQASSTTPVMDGAAAIGTSLRYARANHVHPSDTTKANLSGATFTGQVAVTTGTSKVLVGTDSGGSISIGRTDNVASSPYIDFNSGSTSVDYDVRLSVSGGNGVVGNGTLTVAGSVSFSGHASGIEPINDNHLTTKAYVDSNANSFFLMGG